ncbi:hypothetical protein GCM10014715_81800 [Streptomyces spiralis]|uniref:Uncharacterized protein n=1 Tax=Streptomyces spiralis TaxID=66376 RepID=A0A919ALC8_9ACTN|nr:hypothetical protein GCM10014715_81800 [Streptomyces spiralis]
MAHERTEAPDNTAVRTALWRAMHLQVDSPPHVLEDEIGLQLAAPGDDWRDRPDMDPKATSGFRAAIVARARFIDARAAPAALRAGGAERRSWGVACAGARRALAGAVPRRTV